MRTARKSNSKKETRIWRCIKPKLPKNLEKSLFGSPGELAESKPSEEKEKLKEGMPRPDKNSKGPGLEGKGEELSPLPDLGGIYGASQQEGFQPVPRRFSSLAAKRRRTRSTFISTDGSHSQFDQAALTLAYLKLGEQTQLSDDARVSTTATSPLLSIRMQLSTSTDTPSQAPPPKVKAVENVLSTPPSEERMQLLKTWNGSQRAFNEEIYGRRDSEASYVSEMNREEALKSIIQSRGTGSAHISSIEGYPSPILAAAKRLTPQESYDREKPKGNLAIGVPPLGKSQFHMSEVKFPGPPAKPPNEKSDPRANTGNLATQPTTESLFNTSTYLNMLSASSEPFPPPKRVSSFAPPRSYHASQIDTNRVPVSSQITHELLANTALPPLPPLPAFFPPLPEPTTYNLTEVQSGERSKYVRSVA